MNTDHSAWIQTTVGHEYQPQYDMTVEHEYRSQQDMNTNHSGTGIQTAAGREYRSQDMNTDNSGT